MKIQTRHHNNSSTISLAGRFDASVAQEFKDTINTLIDEGDIFYVVDLSEVNYMDSAALGSLVASLRRVREKEGDIKISSPIPNVRKVFELTRTHRIFDIYDDSNVAAQSFQAA